MFNQKIDNHGNIYLIYDLEENIYGSDIINTIMLIKIEQDINNNKNIKEIYITCINKHENKDYTILENRKKANKIKYENIINNHIYKFPVIYIIYNEKHIAQNNDDLILLKEDEEFMNTGEVG